MKRLSELQSLRLKYKPSLPSVLHKITSLTFIKKEWEGNSDFQELFPQTFNLPFLSFKEGKSDSIVAKPLKVGVVLSGGQAPGGHNVVTAAFDAIKQVHPESKLIGFLNGPGGIIKNQYIELTQEMVAQYRNQGGFDIIGSGRAKIETAEDFAAAGETLQKHPLDGLIIVGGDDSNTNAAFLEEYCMKMNIPTRIIGVPKTIDGDLKNEFIETSFGFDTASKVYAETIGNLAKDSLSAKKYTFFVKLMGRSASHLTLECALKTQVNLALIGEEVLEKKQTLEDVVNEIADLISDRARANKNYGIILIPEGLLEFIPECQELFKELNRLMSDSNWNSITGAKDLKELDNAMQKNLSKEGYECFSTLPPEIQQQLMLDRDPHGNIQLSKIETERLFIALVKRELARRESLGTFKGSFDPHPLFCGYEGRSGLPSNFDCHYCYALGTLAVALIVHQATGYTCSIKNLTNPVEEWEVGGVPIVGMLNFEMRKNKKKAVIRKALVDLEGPVFAYFKKERSKWRVEDHYLCPGPIQFEGPKEISNAPTMTLELEKGAKNNRTLQSSKLSKS